MGFLGGLLGFVIGPDAFFYGIYPLVAKVASNYGLSWQEMGLTMVVGKKYHYDDKPCICHNLLSYRSNRCRTERPYSLLFRTSGAVFCGNGVVSTDFRYSSLVTAAVACLGHPQYSCFHHPHRLFL